MAKNDRLEPAETMAEEKAAGAPAVDTRPLHAVHTPNFPGLLRQLNSSLLVTTYQAGKLVMLRDEGDHLNAHFRVFQAPMGMALRGDRLAIGTTIQIWDYVNVPDVAARLDPPGRHDACYLPRSSHVTGNIQIHEMAFADDGELWVVNTRFSCLCTIDGTASFTPRWRPSFITELEPTDRCHLNGMAMVDGRPRYVTALGETNTPGGWRENKAKGGLLIDIDSNEVITRGLSMPLGLVDLKTGKYEPIVELPGFTRGIDFVGNFAFVGLSQVRESAVFSGIPITQRLTEDERRCGVSVINLLTGQLVALMRFETSVQEIFAVTVLHGRKYPDLINEDDTLLQNSFVVPDAALADVAASVRGGRKV